MSTGIGRHQFSEEPTGPYSTPKAICPYCEYRDCEADYVDVGVGMIQCGPYFCFRCKASEVSYLDKRELTEKEEATGWYAPNTAVSETANTCQGSLVGHKTAQALYSSGLLDN